jgi:hypothetical protein
MNKLPDQGWAKAPWRTNKDKWKMALTQLQYDSRNAFFRPISNTTLFRYTTFKLSFTVI